MSEKQMWESAEQRVEFENLFQRTFLAATDHSSAEFNIGRYSNGTNSASSTPVSLKSSSRERDAIPSLVPDRKGSNFFIEVFLL